MNDGRKTTRYIGNTTTSYTNIQSLQSRLYTSLTIHHVTTSRPVHKSHNTPRHNKQTSTQVSQYTTSQQADQYTSLTIHHVTTSRPVHKSHNTPCHNKQTSTQVSQYTTSQQADQYTSLTIRHVTTSRPVHKSHNTPRHKQTSTQVSQYTTSQADQCTSLTIRHVTSRPAQKSHNTPRHKQTIHKSHNTPRHNKQTSTQVSQYATSQADQRTSLTRRHVIRHTIATRIEVTARWFVRTFVICGLALNLNGRSNSLSHPFTAY